VAGDVSHQFRNDPWVDLAAKQYLLNNNPWFRDLYGGYLIGCVLLGWVGVSLVATFFSTACLGQAAGGCTGAAWYWRPMLLAVGAAGVCTLGWATHNANWNETRDRRKELADALNVERDRRRMFRHKLAGVASDTDLARIDSFWDRPEVSLADDAWIGALIDRWLERNPAEYPSQLDARAARPTRLCVCPPGTSHALCAPPEHVDLAPHEAELARLHAPGVAPSFATSTRLKVCLAVLVSTMLFALANPPTVAAAGPTCVSNQEGTDGRAIDAATGQEVDPNSCGAYTDSSTSHQDSAPAAQPVVPPAASPEPSPTEVPQPQSARLAARSYRVDLTVTVGGDEINAGVHLDVTHLQVHEDPTGLFTAIGRVHNPLGQPVQAVIVLSVMSGQHEVATTFTDAGCIPAGGTRPIHWTGFQATNYSSGADQPSGFQPYDALSLVDSASVLGCGTPPAR